MKEYSFAYGKGAVSVPLDEHQVLGVLHGKEVAPLPDIRKALWESLDAPIDSAPLRALAAPGQKIALVVSDVTRLWMRQDLVVPHLTAYLTEVCGVSPDDVTIVVANGTHRSGDEQELRTLVTDAVFDRFRVENHDCEADDLVYLGTTAHDTPVWVNHTVATADLVVCLGACVHHIMAGFGCRQVDSYYKVEIPALADVIIASCGGFPKDISLYQGTKAIDNVESGVKPGGTIILFIEAPEGGGPEEYFGWAKNLQDGTIGQRLREAFTVAGYIFFQNCEQAQRSRILLYSTIPDACVAPMGMHAYSDLGALLQAAELDGKSIYVIPNGATVIPHLSKEES